MSGTAESIRWILMLAGLFILGFDLAVLRHAAQIVRAVRAWRVFITGKALLMCFVIIVLYDSRHSGEVGWRIPLAGVALILTLIGAVMLDRSYRAARTPQPAKGQPWARR